MNEWAMKSRIASWGIPAGMVVASALLLVLILSGAPSEVTQLLVVVLSIGGAVAAFKAPHSASLLFVFLLLVLSFDPNVRNVITAIGAFTTVGILAHSGRLIYGCFIGAVLAYLGVTDFFHGEFAPTSFEEPILISALTAGPFAAGYYIRKVKEQNLEEKRRAEEARRLQREALIKTLHDSVAGTLTSSVMRIEGVKFNVAIPESEKDELDLIAGENRKAMQEIRDLIRVLQDDSLVQVSAEAPLAEQIEYFTNLLESHGFEVKVHKDESVSQRLFTRELVSLPIMAELASNIVKYAVPESEISVEVLRKESGVLVDVRNAIGSTRTPSYLSTGLGLAQIKKEVEEEGGYFEGVARGDLWVVTWLIPA